MDSKIEELKKKVQDMIAESGHLSAEAEQYLADGNELEWEEAMKRAEALDGKIDGIVYATQLLEGIDLYELLQKDMMKTSTDDSYMVNDIVYLKTLNKVGVITEITQDKRFWFESANGIRCCIPATVLRSATEDEKKYHRTVLSAKEWLKKRQENLKNLSFRCFETTLFPEEKKVLRDAGYYVYDLRDWDEGDGYNIELHVTANNIGNWITDTDLTPYFNDGSWIGIDELKEANMEEIPYDEIKELLIKGRALHHDEEIERD